MVKANAFEKMLEVLRASHSLKSWTIYNDRYNGDVVVRVRFAQEGQIGEEGETVNPGTYKRKTPQQAARDQARANNYKQSRNAKQNNETTQNIGKSSLRSFTHADIEVNRGELNLSLSPSNVIDSLGSPVYSPVHPSSPVSSPILPESSPVEILPVSHSVQISPVSQSMQISPVSHSVQISPVSHSAKISLLSRPEQIPHDLQRTSPLNEPVQLDTPVPSPVQSPSHIDNAPSLPFSSPVHQPTSVLGNDRSAPNLDDMIQDLRETMRQFRVSMETSFINIPITTDSAETFDISPD